MEKYLSLLKEIYKWNPGDLGLRIVLEYEIGQISYISGHPQEAIMYLERAVQFLMNQ